MIDGKPDGSTLLIWNDALPINPSLFAGARYKPERDFTMGERLVRTTGTKAE